MQLVFATNNAHKLREVKRIIDNRYTIISLKELGFTDDIPEPYETLEENALEKVRVIHRIYGGNCFAEDTGLEIDALNGEPGVYTARYAGAARSAAANMQKVLKNLQASDNRSARFRTVIALILEGKEYLFEGIAEGNITHTIKGIGGFGYDPVFQPIGYNKTFAELDEGIKNTISHRAKATEKLANFLQEYRHF